MTYLLYRRMTVLAALTLLFFPSPNVAAQEQSQLPRPFCFRGRTMARCRAFAITEFGADARLYGPRIELIEGSPGGARYDIAYSFRPTAFSVTAEAGAMINTSARNALGGAVVLRNGSGGAQVGLKIRYRRWLSPEGMALDAAVGVMSGDGAVNLNGNQPAAVTGDIAINVQDYAALRVRVDLNRTSKGTHPAIYAGVRAGSFPALGAAALALTGFAVVFAIFAHVGVD